MLLFLNALALVAPNTMLNGNRINHCWETITWRSKSINENFQLPTARLVIIFLHTSLTCVLIFHIESINKLPYKSDYQQQLQRQRPISALDFLLLPHHKSEGIYLARNTIVQDMSQTTKEFSNSAVYFLQAEVSLPCLRWGAIFLIILLQAGLDEARFCKMAGAWSTHDGGYLKTVCQEFYCCVWEVYWQYRYLCKP